MARISYKDGTSSFRRILNHAPEMAEAYWKLREALSNGSLPPKVRMLSFLACDVTNHCRY